MFSDAPYWRPPSRALSMVFQTYGLEARFWPNFVVQNHEPRVRDGRLSVGSYSGG
jgi:hypothetical protein